MGVFEFHFLFQTLSDFFPKHSPPPEVELKVPSIGTLVLLLLVALHLLFLLLELGSLTLLVLLAMDLKFRTHTV